MNWTAFSCFLFVDNRKFNYLSWQSEVFISYTFPDNIYLYTQQFIFGFNISDYFKTLTLKRKKYQNTERIVGIY